MAEVPRGTIPDTLRSWVDERAARADAEPAEILSRAVTLYRLVEEHAESAGEMPADDDLGEELERLTERVATVDDFDALGERLDTLAERAAAVDDLERRVDRLADAVDTEEDDEGDRLADEVATLTERVRGVEDDLDEKITDVRERVIQVKRDADAGQETLDDRLDGVESTVDAGFENFETVLSRLVDEVEASDEKLTRLASVVVSLRRRLGTAEYRLTRLDAGADLKTAANRHGETKAKCGDCGGSVSLGLLTEPRCPHCGADFVDIEPSSRPFSSATLTTGQVPALTAGDDANTTDEGAAATNGHDALEDAATELLEESNRV
jgi:uncharacterized protein YceH (UPF0502 family)